MAGGTWQTRVLFCLIAVCVIAGSPRSHAQTPPAAATSASADPRGKLDEALRLASELKYDAAITVFEEVKSQHPEAITGLDGLKMVVVYAEVGNAAKHEELTRWLVERYRTPRTATEAERAVKGYSSSTARRIRRCSRAVPR